MNVCCYHQVYFICQ